jgi:hypothetical protein
MLALLSILVLQTEHGHVLPRIANVKKTSNSAPSSSPRAGNVDYFSLKKPTTPVDPISFAWARIPSPKALHALSGSSTSSSRGSWSSLFNTGTVRQFMSGMQDTLKEGLLTPSEVPLPVTTPEIQITTVPSPVRTTDSNTSQRRKKRPKSVVAKSWTVASLGNPSRKTTLPTSSGEKRLSLRFVGPGPLISEKRVVFEPPPLNVS